MTEEFADGAVEAALDVAAVLSGPERVDASALGPEETEEATYADVGENASSRTLWPGLRTLFSCTEAGKKAGTVVGIGVGSV